MKSWRYFEQALHYLLPQKKRFDFKETSRYITIDPDIDSKAIRLKETSLQSKRHASIRRADFSDGFFSSYSDNNKDDDIFASNINS